MYTFENTKSGLKVYKEGKHVKTIPSKYESVFDPLSISYDKKRLNNSERFNLEHAYFMKILSISEKYVYELFKDSKPVIAREVKNRIDETRYEMLYDNGKRLKITLELYRMFEEKDMLHYSNY